MLKKRLMNGLLDFAPGAAKLRTAPLALFALLLSACVDPTAVDFPDGAVPDRGARLDRSDGFVFPDQTPLPDTDGSSYPTNMKMYAHSKSQLFVLVPGSLQLTLVGTFSPSTADINDIAITPTGQMYALSINDLYLVDPATAKLTLATHVAGTANVSLTFEASGKYLLAADKTGTLRRIHFEGANKGKVEVIGTYGQSQSSSGDLVGIRDGTVFDATDAGGGATKDNNKLVTVNITTGKAQAICSIGHAQVWGLAHWQGVIYGFTKDGKMLSIKLTYDELKHQWTGCSASLIRKYNYEFWGAAVNPLAPIQ